jgi:hypothetical protein
VVGSREDPKIREKEIKTMKKIFVLIAALLFFSCGADAQQVGMPSAIQTVTHGHSGPTDGGTLNAPRIKIVRSAFYSVTCSSLAKVQLDSKVDDPNNWFDQTINYRFQPTGTAGAGKWLIIVKVAASGTTVADCFAYIYKNGSAVFGVRSDAYNATGCSAETSWVEVLNGSTDYIELFHIVSAASGCNIQGVNSGMAYTTTLQAVRISN